MTSTLDIDPLPFHASVTASSLFHLESIGLSLLHQFSKNGDVKTGLPGIILGAFKRKKIQAAIDELTDQLNKME